MSDLVTADPQPLDENGLPEDPKVITLEGVRPRTRFEGSFAGMRPGTGVRVTDYELGYRKGIDNEELRATGQSALGLVGKSALNTALVGVGSLVSGAGIIFDPTAWSALVSDSDYDWDNALLSMGSAIQDMGPTIHLTKTAQGGSWERFLDATYWAGNAPSIASTMSMIVPGMAVAKVAGALARGATRRAITKGLRAAGIRATNTGTRKALEGVGIGLGTVVNQHASGILESLEIYDQAYTDGIERGLSNDQAKAYAGQAAASTYRTNYANIWQQGLSLMLATRAANMFNRGVVNEVAAARRAVALGGNAADDLLESAARASAKYGGGATKGAIAFEGASEAWEEVFIQYAKQAGTYYADKLNGFDTSDKDTHRERWANVFNDPKTWDAALFGFIGGAGIMGLSSTYDKVNSASSSRTADNAALEALRRRTKNFRDSVSALTAYSKGENPDPDTPQRIHDEYVIETAMEGLVKGDLQFEMELYNELEKRSDEELEKLGMDRQALNQIKEQLETAVESYEEHAANPLFENEDAAAFGLYMTEAELRMKQANGLEQANRRRVDEIRAKLTEERGVFAGEEAQKTLDSIQREGAINTLNRLIPELQAALSTSKDGIQSMMDKRKLAAAKEELAVLMEEREASGEAGSAIALLSNPKKSPLIADLLKATASATFEGVLGSAYAGHLTSMYTGEAAAEFSGALKARRDEMKAKELDRVKAVKDAESKGRKLAKRLQKIKDSVVAAVSSVPAETAAAAAATSEPEATASATPAAEPAPVAETPVVVAEEEEKVPAKVPKKFTQEELRTTQNNLRAKVLLSSGIFPEMDDDAATVVVLSNMIYGMDPEEASRAFSSVLNEEEMALVAAYLKGAEQILSEMDFSEPAPAKVPAEASEEVVASDPVTDAGPGPEPGTGVEPQGSVDVNAAEEPTGRVGDVVETAAEPTPAPEVQEAPAQETPQTAQPGVQQDLFAEQQLNEEIAQAEQLEPKVVTTDEALQDVFTLPGVSAEGALLRRHPEATDLASMEDILEFHRNPESGMTIEVRKDLNNLDKNENLTPEQKRILSQDDVSLRFQEGAWFAVSSSGSIAVDPLALPVSAFLMKDGKSLGVVGKITKNVGGKAAVTEGLRNLKAAAFNGLTTAGELSLKLPTFNSANRGEERRVKHKRTKPTKRVSLKASVGTARELNKNLVPATVRKDMADGSGRKMKILSGSSSEVQEAGSPQSRFNAFSGVFVRTPFDEMEFRTYFLGTDSRKLNAEEADVYYAMVSKILGLDGPAVSLDDQVGELAGKRFKNVSYGQLFNLITANSPTALQWIKGENGQYVGLARTYKGQVQQFTRNGLKQDPQAFKDFLQKHLVFHVSSKGTEENRLSAFAIDPAAPITLFGTTYAAEASYMEFLLEQDTLTVDVAPANNTIFAEPEVHLDLSLNLSEQAPAVDSVSINPVAEAAAMENAQVDVSQIAAETSEQEAPQARSFPNALPAKDLKGLFRTVRPTDVNSKPMSAQERAHVAKILDVPVTVVSGLLRVAESGAMAYGMFSDGMITLSDQAISGVVFHEAFHAVSQAYLTDEEYKALIDEARQLYGTDDLVALEEYLAEDFKDYALGRLSSDSLMGKIADWFAVLRDHLLRLFGRPYNRRRLFQAIYSGRFKGKPIQVRKFTASPTLYSRRSTALGVDQKTLESLHRMMLRVSARAVELTEGSGLTRDLVSLMPQDSWSKETGWSGVIHDSILARLGEVNPELQELLLVPSKYGMLWNSYVDFLRENKIIVDRIDMATDEDSELEKETASSSGDPIDRKPYELSMRDTASTNVKLMLMTRSATESAVKNEKGVYQAVPKFDPVTGMAEPLSVAEIDAKLHNLLADIPPSGNGEGFDAQMLDRLASAAEFDPDIAALYEDLRVWKESYPSRFTQFVSYARSMNQNFVNVVYEKRQYQIDEEQMESGAFRVVDPQLQSFVSKHVANWRTDLITALMPQEADGTTVLDTSRLTSALNLMRQELKFTQSEDQMFVALQNLMATLGITYDKKALNYYFREIPFTESEIKERQAITSKKDMKAWNDLWRKTQIAVLWNRFAYLAQTEIKGTALPVNKSLVFLSQLTDVNTFISEATSKGSLFNDSLFYDLATSYARAYPEMMSQSVYDGEKNFFSLARPNELMNETQELKSSPEKAKEILSTEFGANSKWAKELSTSARTREKFKIVTVLSMRDKGSDEGPVSAAKLEPIDMLMMQFELMLEGREGERFFPVMNNADKSEKRLVAGMSGTFGQTTVADDAKVPRTLSEWAKTVEVSQGWVDEMAGHVIYEIKRIQSMQDMDAGTFEHVEHLTPTGGNVANGLRFTLFEDLNPDVAKEGSVARQISDMLWTKDEGGVARMNSEALQALPELMDSYVRSMLANEIAKQFQEFQSLGAIVQGSEKGTAGFVPKLVSDRLVRPYKGRGTAGTLRAVADFTLNGIRANFEFMKLFMGDPAVFKSIPDMWKRPPGLSAYGQYAHAEARWLRQDGTIETFPEKFGVMTLQDITEEVSNLEEIRQSLIKVGVDSNEVEMIIAAYKNPERTDAYALVSPERYRQLKIQLGEWSNAAEQDYQLMMEGKPVVNGTTFKPLKGVYYGVETVRLGDMSFRIPRYMKYSQAMLMPSRVKGDPLLEKLWNATRPDADGQQRVSEFTFASGFKVGAGMKVDPTTADLTTAPVLMLSNSKWRLQVPMPDHGMEMQLRGTQVSRNIFGTLEKAAEYDYDGNVLTGEQVFDRVQNLESELINRQFTDVVAELGLEKTASGWKIDRAKLSEFFFKNSRDLPINVREMLEDVMADGNGLLDAVLEPVQLMNLLYSKLNKALVKPKMYGGSLIQESGLMLRKSYGMDTNGIIWLTKDEGELKGPVIDPVTGQIEAAEILLPYHLSKQFDMADPDSVRKFFEENPNLLHGIGYRIPNQATSSIEHFKVVGFLPPEAGDSVVVYNGFTTKTGSDFDIDKLYVMLYEYDVKSAFPARFKGLPADHVITEQDVQNAMETALEDSSLAEAASAGDAEFLAELLDLKDIDKTAKRQEWMARRMAKAVGMTVEQANKLTPEGLAVPSMPLDKASDKQLRNSLLDMYRVILKHPNAYKKLMIPLDYKSPKKAIESIAGRSKTTGLGLMSARNQNYLSTTFLEGKRNIGVVANAIVDYMYSRVLQEETQVDIELYAALKQLLPEDSLRVKKTEFGDTLHILTGAEKDDLGLPVAHNLSMLLNAFVDIAKDPYIFKANINDATLAPVILLMRGGASFMDVVRVTTKQAVKDYAFFKKAESSMLLDEQYTKSKKGSVRKTPIIKVIEKALKGFYEAQPEGKVPGSVSAMIDSLRKEFPGGKLPSALFTAIQILNAPENLDNFSATVSEPIKGDGPAHELARYMQDLALWHTLESSSVALNTSTLAWKIYVKGAGKDIYDLHESIEKLAPHVKSPRMRTSLGTIYRRLHDVYSLTQELFLEARMLPVTSKYLQVQGITATADRMRAAGKHLASFVKTARQDGDYSRRMSELIRRKKTAENPDILKQFEQVRSKVGELPFVKHLNRKIHQMVTATAEDGSKKVMNFFLLFGDSSVKTQETKNRFSEDWDSMLSSPDEQVRLFAESLAYYAIGTSAYQFGSTTLFQYLPASYNQAAIGAMKTAMTAVMQANAAAAFTQVARHNPNNRNFVRSLPKNRVGAMGNSLEELMSPVGGPANAQYMLVPTTESDKLSGLSESTMTYGEGLVVSRNVNNNKELYMFQGAIEIAGEPGVQLLYSRITPLGKNLDGVKVYEYDMASTWVESMFFNKTVLQDQGYVQSTPMDLGEIPAQMIFRPREEVTLDELMNPEPSRMLPVEEGTTLLVDTTEQERQDIDDSNSKCTLPS